MGTRAQKADFLCELSYPCSCVALNKRSNLSASYSFTSILMGITIALPPRVVSRVKGDEQSLVPSRHS